MPSHAVTKSPMAKEAVEQALLKLGWTQNGDEFSRDGWVIHNLRAVESAPEWGGHTHTLMDVSLMLNDAPDEVLEETIIEAIPTWGTDDDNYRLGWDAHDDDDDDDDDDEVHLIVHGVEYTLGDDGPASVYLCVDKAAFEHEDFDVSEALNESYPAAFCGYRDVEMVTDPDRIAGLDWTPDGMFHIEGGQ